MITPDSHEHSYVHYSLSSVRSEWFTKSLQSHSQSQNRHRLTPIKRIVATKVYPHRVVGEDEVDILGHLPWCSQGRSTTGHTHMVSREVASP